jgi:hypothetical protein
MRNVYIILFVVAACVSAFYSGRELGRADERTRQAQAVTAAALEETGRAEAARDRVDSADDCAVKRMLCEFYARGECDQERVCDTAAGVRDPADMPAVDGSAARHIGK